MEKETFTFKPSKEPTPWAGPVTDLALFTGHFPEFAGSYKPRTLSVRNGGVCNQGADKQLKLVMRRDIAKLAESHPELDRFTGSITVHFTKGGLPTKVIFTLD